MIILLMSIFAGFALSVQDLIEPVLSKATQYLSFEEILPLRSSSRALNSDLQKTFEHRFKEEVSEVVSMIRSIGPHHASEYTMVLTLKNRCVVRYWLPYDLLEFVDDYFTKPDKFWFASGYKVYKVYKVDDYHPAGQYIRYISNKINRDRERAWNNKIIKHIRDRERAWNNKISKHMLIAAIFMHISSPFTFILEECFGYEDLQLRWNLWLCYLNLYLFTPNRWNLWLCCLNLYLYTLY